MQTKQPFATSISLVFTAGLVVALISCGGPSTQPVDTGTDDWVPGDTTDSGSDVTDDDTTTDTFEDPVEECVPTGTEICDGLDNDCNGTVDDGFNLSNDPLNCGWCAYACVVANGTAACSEGECTVGSCNDGFRNLNGASWDGCEYACTSSAVSESTFDGTCVDTLDNDCDGRADASDPDCSTCVPEFCDGVDNDCDSLVDEDYSTSTDPLNCGSCGNTCPGRPHARPACVLGACTVTCEAGWLDADGIAENGCEAECSPLPSPEEFACDGVDADCDGMVDEDYIPYTCGSGLCITNSVCWHGAEDCVPITPPAVTDTICDGQDEDCDGLTDEEFAPSDLCTGYCRTTATCSAGAETCGAPASGLDSTCDLVDDDCDATADEEYIPYTCGSGGCMRQSTCIGGYENCMEGGAAPEICNGSDDDCDDVIDNGDPSAMCMPVPPHGTGSCSGGVCSVGSCDGGFYDVDLIYGNGCECTLESTETLSTSCAVPYSLGTFADSGATTTVSGNIVPAGDMDWYSFTATDGADSGSPLCDAFDAVAAFTSNPGNVFRMDVYRGSCGDASPCVNVADTMEWYTNFRTGSMASARGECPCAAGVTYDRNICTDNSATFYIVVYRAAGAPVTCDNYTIRVSNGM